MQFQTGSKHPNWKGGKPIGVAERRALEEDVMDEIQNQIMRMAGFGKEIDRCNQGLCPICGKKIDPKEFKTPLDFKEFTISGMCQECQNKHGRWTDEDNQIGTPKQDERKEVKEG